MTAPNPRWQRYIWILYPVLLLAALSSWALSSAPGSSPDEDYHLVSIWCGLGLRDGLCTAGPTPTTRMVADDVVNSSCFQAAPKQSGRCPQATGPVETDNGNFNNSYPGGFYATMGLFAGPSVEVSVLLMRLFNAGIYVAAITALLGLVGTRRRTNYMLVSLATLVPLGIFLIPSANPSSWAITSATVLWASLVEFTRAEERGKKIGLVILAAFGFAMALASRADATAYAAAALALAWFVTAKRDRKTLIRGGIAVVLIGVAYAWYRTLGQTSMVGPRTDPFRPAEPPDAWFHRILGLTELILGAFGPAPLGWLDTPMPSMTRLLAGGIAAMVLIWGLRRCSWRKATSLVAILALLITLPMIVLAADHLIIGEGVQARYLFPLVILAMMIAISQDNPRGSQLNWAQATVIALSLGLANAAALHTNIRRYVTGLDDPHFNLSRKVEWWWQAGPSPMMIFAAGSLLFFAAAAAVLVYQRFTAAPESPQTEPSARSEQV